MMNKIITTCLVLCLCACGAGDKGENSGQDIGDVIPNQTALTSTSYQIAKDICYAFNKKRQSINNGDISLVNFKTYEEQCDESSYDFIADINARISRLSIDSYSITVISGGSVISSVETDKSGMLQQICADIDFNNNVSPDQQRSISLISDLNGFRYYFSFSTRGSSYLVTRGKYALIGDQYINQANEVLTIYSVDSHLAGLVKERETIEQCLNSNNVKKFKQVLN